MGFGLSVVTMGFPKWVSFGFPLFPLASIFGSAKLELLDDLMITFCYLLKLLHLNTILADQLLKLIKLLFVFFLNLGNGLTLIASLLLHFLSQQFVLSFKIHHNFV